jgi:hypothetical protein
MRKLREQHSVTERSCTSRQSTSSLVEPGGCSSVLTLMACTVCVARAPGWPTEALAFEPKVQLDEVAAAYTSRLGATCLTCPSAR